jgi:hypothetical protein
MDNDIRNNHPIKQTFQGKMKNEKINQNSSTNQHIVFWVYVFDNPINRFISFGISGNFIICFCSYTLGPKMIKLTFTSKKDFSDYCKMKNLIICENGDLILNNNLVGTFSKLVKGYRIFLY